MPSVNKPVIKYFDDKGRPYLKGHVFGQNEASNVFLNGSSAAFLKSILICQRFTGNNYSIKVANGFNLNLGHLVLEATARLTLLQLR